MIQHKDFETARDLIKLLRGDMLERTMTIKTTPQSSKAEIKQAMHEARLLGLQAIRALDEFEFAVETYRIVCICQEDLE